MTVDSLATQVAVRSGVPLPTVERVFDEQGFAPGLPGALPRPVQLRRLRIAGIRSVPPLGPFDSELRFGSGLTVLAADNLRGKTSVLELLTWCLRGSPRSGLQGVVRTWLSRLECDVVVAGRVLGFRLILKAGELIEGRVLSAANTERLARVDTARPDDGITEILHARDQDGFSAMVETLMMELLHLERLEFTSSRTGTGKAAYGWPAYFGALYLPPGGEPALLGDVVVGGLAGRLLQVFLDLPSAALLTRIKAARDQLAEVERTAEADASRMRRLLDGQRRASLAQLQAARAEFEALREQPSTATLVGSMSALTESAIVAEASLREARETYELLRWQRQNDEKRLNDVREHQAARLLFHALDPKVCPRCEAPISPERRAAERTRAVCAVCTGSIGHGPDPQQAAAAEEEAQWRLTTSRNAEAAARAHRDDIAARAEERRQALAAAERALAMADAGDATDRRRELVNLIARLEGAVAALEALPVPADDRREDVRIVLDAAVAILTEDQEAASDELFGELNANVAELARSFGFRNLDHVMIDRAGRLQVFKTGGPREWFRTQSPGERLRLRIAVVAALLRIGHRHGIATHPGLLFIDSPRSEEIQDDDAVALLTALERLCVETPGLQILVTTADEALVRRSLTRTTIIAPPGPGQPLW
jgi:hypothetical protein